MFDDILLPVDGSEASANAVAYAVRLADASEATVHVLAVRDTGPLPHALSDLLADGYVDPTLLAAAGTAVEDAVAACEAAGVPVTARIVTGHPTDVILDTLSANDSDLVVLGVHPPGALVRFLRRSVAEQVAHHAPVPVLTVGARGPALDPHVRWILVAVDGSPCAERASEYAIDLATTFDASVEGLYVVEDRFGSSGPLRALLESTGETVLRELRVHGAREGVAVTTTTRTGTPAREILTHAAAQPVDLLVLGTHGRDGLDRVVMGSVAARVIRAASVPVLTVRATDLGD